MRGGFGRLSREVRILLLMPEYEMGEQRLSFAILLNVRKKIIGSWMSLLSKGFREILYY